MSRCNKKPSAGRQRGRFKNSDQIQDESEEHKSKCKPLRHLGKLFIPGFCFALGEEVFSTAGNCTGKACAFATLHQNDNSNAETGENLKNCKEDFDTRHRYSTFLSNNLTNKLCYYNTRLSKFQVFFIILWKVLLLSCMLLAVVLLSSLWK